MQTLRGLVDASDYKQYIFPLLFFKRLSDVWDGDYQQTLDEAGDEGYATDTANDRFVIPEAARRQRSRPGSRAAPIGRSTSHPHQPAGSTRSNAGQQN